MSRSLKNQPFFVVLHIGFAQLGDLLEDRVSVTFAGIVGINQFTARLCERSSTGMRGIREHLFMSGTQFTLQVFECHVLGVNRTVLIINTESVRF